MRDPSYELQKAVYQALNAALTGVGIHDRVPPSASLPYVEFGHDQIIGDEAGGGDFCDAHVEVRVFAKTMAEAKTIGRQIVQALDTLIALDAPVTCHECEWESSRFWDDGDGVFTGQIGVRYWLQTAE